MRLAICVILILNVLFHLYACTLEPAEPEDAPAALEPLPKVSGL